MNADSRIRLLLPRKGFVLNVDLQLPAQGVTVLYGASGSGKTSVLRAVAGLDRAPEAYVRVAGQLWQDESQKVFLPTWQRPLGYVFQESSLFEHLDVRANLGYGMKRTPSAHPAALAAALDEAIHLLGIGTLLARRTDTLSGGERQRVAIARALALQPAILLLDEPLASIDHSRRQEILPWLEKLRDESRVPMLYVTHSADELARMADHVVLLEGGRVRASGPVAEVLAAQGNTIFSGDEAGALFAGTVEERDTAWHLARVSIPGGDLWVRDHGLAIGTRVRLRVLARDVSLAWQEPQGTSIQNHLRAVVEGIDAEAHPSQALVRLRCGSPGATLLARVTQRSLHRLGIQPGSQVWAQVKSVALVE